VTATRPTSTTATTLAGTERQAGSGRVVTGGSPWRGRLLVLAAILMSAATLRVAVTSFSPLAERIGAEIGYSTAAIGVFGMIPTAMFALSGLTTPVLTRRIGLEWTVLTAMLLSGAGMAIRAVAPGTAELLVCTAVATAGMGIGNVVIPPLVKRYFPDRMAVLGSLYITTVQVGTVASALVAVPIADEFGWRVSLGVWALLGFASALPWLGVLRAGRRSSKSENAAVPGTAASEGPSVRIVRSPLAWGMAAMFGMTALVTYAVFAWLPRVLTDAGASASFAGSMVGLFALLGLGPSLAAPAVVARMRNPFPLVLGCAALLLVAFAGLLFAPTSLPVLWVVALGLGTSTFPISLTLINLRTTTPSGSATLSGFTQGVGYAIACAGPLLFGILRTATGGWAVPFALLTAAVLVLVIGAWQACAPRMLEDTGR